MSTGWPINEGKTSFLEDFLPDNRDASLTTLNEAWAEAGNEGSISGSLVSRVRTKLGLTRNRRADGGATADRKARSQTNPRSLSKRASRNGRKRDGSLNKTSFIQEELRRDGTLNAKAIKQAWTDAGNDGSISDNLFYTTKAALGIESMPGSSRDQPASSEARPPLNRDVRELHDIEGEIDEMIFRLRTLGGYDDVQEALRGARRLLVRSHGE